MSGDSKAVADPDNVPPQSRLFIVVPKTSDGTLIEVTTDAEAEKPSLFHLQGFFPFGPCYRTLNLSMPMKSHPQMCV